MRDTEIFKMAQAWQEHCREQAEYFYGEGEDDTAHKWDLDAAEAENTLKRHIDTPAPPRDIEDALAEVFHHPDFVIGNVLTVAHLRDAGFDVTALPQFDNDMDHLSEVMWDVVSGQVPMVEE